MAKIVCDFYSEVLSLSTSMTVILPQISESQKMGEQNSTPQKGFKTLWLLHGYSDDHTAWTRQTSIERYATFLGLAVVMPQVDHSYYCNMAHGKQYWTFISEELPAIARSFFPLSTDKKDNYVAGLSMGGFGAFKLALHFPERYIAAGSFSGVMDMILRSKEPSRENTMSNIFGENPQIQGSGNDLFFGIENHSHKKEAESKLHFFQCCGTEDFLYEENIRLRDKVQTLDVELTYREEAGSHEWGFWDKYIKEFLLWLKEKNLI